MITSVAPIIAVSDAAKAEHYYCRTLGFERNFDYQADASRTEPRYVGLSRDGIAIHLQSFKPERAGMTDAYFWVQDVDHLYAEIFALDAIIQLPPTDQTWGTREIAVRDPDGNVLVFGQRLLK